MHNEHTMKEIIKKIIIFSLLTLLLISPVLIRFITQQPLFIGTIPYYNLHLAQQFWKQGVIFNDQQIQGGRLTILTPYHLLLALLIQILSKQIPNDLILTILNTLLVISTFILLIRTINTIKPLKYLTYHILILYVISIPSLSMLLSPTPLTFFLFLYISAIYLFLNKKTNYANTILFIFSLHGIFETFISIATIYFLQRINLQHTNKDQKPTKFFFFLIFYTFAFQIPKSFFITLPLTETKSFITEFGGLMSESIIPLILAFIGILFIWNYKKQQYTLYFFLILLLFISFFNSDVIPYTNFFIIFLAAHSIHAFINLKFQLKTIKPIFLCIIFIGLLIQPIIFVMWPPTIQPTKEILTFLTTLPSTLKANIFSTPETGILISSLTKATTITDTIPTRYLHQPRIKIRTQQALYSNELTALKNRLNNLKTTHILLTPKIRKNQPRFAELLTNNETFKSIKAENGYELYTYLP